MKDKNYKIAVLFYNIATFLGVSCFMTLFGFLGQKPELILAILIAEIMLCFVAAQIAVWHDN